MASNSSSDKPASPPTSPPQRPPPADDFFDSIRRFTEHHISSVLHSLIGLPTMLPPSNTWIMDEEDMPRPSAPPSDASRPTPTPTELINATQESKSPTPASPPQSTRGRMAECYLLTDPRTPIFRPEEDERPAQVWRQVSALHRDFAAPFFGGDVWGTGMGKGWEGGFVKPLFWSVGMMGKREEEEGGTELDAYNQLAPRNGSTFMHTPTPATTVAQQGEEGKPRVVATVATTRSFTGPDGVTRTKYMLKKRFTDGSEERVEEERTEGRE